MTSQLGSLCKISINKHISQDLTKSVYRTLDVLYNRSSDLELEASEAGSDKKMDEADQG